MKHAALLTAVTLGAVLVPASAAVAKSPSRGAYRKQVDAVCKSIDTEITKAIRKAYPTGPKDTTQTTEAIVKILIPARAKQWKTIFALPVPKSDQQKIASIKDLATQEMNALRRDPSTALRSDPFINTDLAWDDYGLKVCPAPLATER